MLLILGVNSLLTSRDMRSLHDCTTTQVAIVNLVGSNVIAKTDLLLVSRVGGPFLWCTPPYL